MFDIMSFVVGFFFATALGVLAQRARQYTGAINAPNRPMSTFPDAAQPNLTSRGVVSSGYRAYFWRMLYSIFFLLALAIGIWIIRLWISSYGISIFGRTICF